MKIPSLWIDRAKFVLGVLLVMGGVSFTTNVWREFHRDHAFLASRLEPYQLCKVSDFDNGPNSPFAPTECLVETLEYQADPAHHQGEKNLRELIDMDTIVLVIDDDLNDPVINRDGHDDRLVYVQFVTGRYSGRKGLIARRKLKPFSTRPPS
jgi:hypothetical protein